jgi:hypothetical protein
MRYLNMLIGMHMNKKCLNPLVLKTTAHSLYQKSSLLWAGDGDEHQLRGTFNYKFHFFSSTDKMYKQLAICQDKACMKREPDLILGGVIHFLMLITYQVFCFPNSFNKVKKGSSKQGQKG